MAQGYVYLVVQPASSDHPMNMILGAGHHLYEAKHIIFEQNLDENTIEIWRMRAGKIQKDKIENWMEKKLNE